MRYGLTVCTLFLALPLGAEETAPAAPAVEVHLAPSGILREVEGRHVLDLKVDTDLPAQAIIQAYLKRVQYSTTGETTSHLIDSKRFQLGEDRAKPCAMELKSALTPAVYDVEVVFDSQRQYPDVAKQLAGVPTLRRTFQVVVGSEEEIAMEHEWGESRVLGFLKRWDEVAESAKTGVLADDQVRRLDWMAARLGKAGAASPLPEIQYPRTEELLKRLCNELAKLKGEIPDPAGSLAGFAAARAKVEETYAVEFTVLTLMNMHNWYVFVHQEYWLNRIHKRLSPEQWTGFKAEQRKRLDQLENAYVSYATSQDPRRVEVAKYCPPYVKTAAACLRTLQAAYDADLEAKVWKPGEASEKATREFLQIYRMLNLQVRPVGHPRPE